jgi:hypothetical protein
LKEGDISAKKFGDMTPRKNNNFNFLETNLKFPS